MYVFYNVYAGAVTGRNPTGVVWCGYGLNAVGTTKRQATLRSTTDKNVHNIRYSQRSIIYTVYQSAGIDRRPPPLTTAKNTPSYND